MNPIHTTNAPAAIGPYSQAYEANGFLFTSGQIAIIPETGEIADGINSQAHQCCKNIGAILDAAGCSYDNVIKTTCFLSDMKDFAVFNEIYAEYFSSRPARSCVAVKELPRGVLCEIDAIAVK